MNRARGRGMVDCEVPTKRAKMLEVLLNGVWQAWQREYVALLQKRKGDWGRTYLPRLDQVVLVMDENLARGYWQLGRVIELFEGRDGRVRSARVRTEKGELLRAVQSLVPLECSTESSQ